MIVAVFILALMTFGIWYVCEDLRALREQEQHALEVGADGVTPAQVGDAGHGMTATVGADTFGDAA